MGIIYFRKDVLSYIDSLSQHRTHYIKRKQAVIADSLFKSQATCYTLGCGLKLSLILVFPIRMRLSLGINNHDSIPGQDLLGIKAQIRN